MTVHLGKLLQDMQTRMRPHGLASEVEQWLVAAYREHSSDPSQVLKRPEFLMRLHEKATSELTQRVLQIAQNRIQQIPLQHILGVQTFLNHEYQVNPDVLIPRPETEVLVTTILETFQTEAIVPQTGIEIGLGSGIISIELLSYYSNLTLFASEWSPKAMDQGVKNAQKILGTGAHRLKVHAVKERQHVFEPFDNQHPVDFIVTNPPYLLATENEVEWTVQLYEPEAALFAPVEDPLYFYRVIAQKGHLSLVKGGFVFAEMPHERAKTIAALFQSYGWSTRIFPDLTQRPRILVACVEDTQD